MEDEFIEIAKQFLLMVASDVDSYVSEKSVIKQEGVSSVSLFTQEHYQFAKYGRGPGKQPPINKIIDFVKKKGIIFENSTQEGTAWAIAKSIAKNGTKGYTPNAPNALQESIDKHLLEYSNEIAKEMITVVGRETKKIYNERFPIRDSFKI